MKKKTVHASKTRATRRPSTSKRTLFFRRIVVISACLVLVAVAAVLVNKQSVEQKVAGAAVMRGLFVQGTVTIPTLTEATSYNIYYKEDKEKEFTNAVRNVPTTVATYTISHLKKGANYQYRFAAVDKNGREFLFSEVLPLTNVKPM